MINIFFQEWAPLFPVLHRPTFLALYERYVSSPEDLHDKKSIAKLNLCFGIAALSSDVRTLFGTLRRPYPLTLGSHAMIKTSNLLKLNGKAPLTRS